MERLEASVDPFHAHAAGIGGSGVHTATASARRGGKPDRPTNPHRIIVTHPLIKYHSDPLTTLTSSTL